MDNMKRNIVLVITVIFIGLGIIGGVFAWVILGLNVTNGNYVIETENYVIDYVKGTDVSNLPSLFNGTPGEANYLMVRAKKRTDNFTANLTIYLNTLPETDNELIEEKIINYAVCVSSCDSFSQTYTLTSTDKTVVIENSMLTTEYTDYYVYFWLDASTEMDNLVNKNYYGFISAEAVLR